ncbi:MAG TPA: M23 family metallopeptidase [Bacilli bacterium]|nr:M23 family metallopeptidase [Bacilli bacterium]
MKIVITKGQAVRILNEQSLMDDPEINQYAPNFERLVKLLRSPTLSDTLDATRTDGNDNTVTNVENQPNQYVDTNKNFRFFQRDSETKTLDDNVMMHPLGKKYPISSEFGLRNTTVGGRDHKAIDIAVKSGSPVYAPLDGIVEVSKDTSPNPCGGHIRINHGDVITKYCHLRQLVVRKGENVKKGQIIAYSGGGKNDPMRGRATGPHLHYEILNKSGIAMNPVSVQKNLAEEKETKKNTYSKIKDFADFVRKELKIKHPPTIVITNKRDGLKTTANYDYGSEQKIMKVYAKNRMLVDVMRSVAHELIHHQQWEKGLLKTPPPDIGGPIEDEANAVAGQLIKKYALKDSTIYDE